MIKSRLRHASCAALLAVGMLLAAAAAWPLPAAAVTVGLPGTLLPWSEVDGLLPRKSIFQVLDPETGLVFRVQRRAGSAHADVQPLTKQDTEIMKQIYGGAWSWNRKAIIVIADSGQRIAASMHGMPHGGDGIPGNNFSGHFCIHFLGCTTHKSRSVDPGHQLMVHRAAGQLERYVNGMTPERLIETFVFGLHQRDLPLLRLLYAPLAENDWQELQAWVKPIKAARLASLPADEPAGDALAAARRAEVHVQRDGDRFRKLRLTFELRREMPGAPWKIAALALPR